MSQPQVKFCHMYSCRTNTYEQRKHKAVPKPVLETEKFQLSVLSMFQLHLYEADTCIPEPDPEPGSIMACYQK